MAAKLVFGLLAVAFVIAVATFAVYRYFDNQAQREHEKEMLREKRDAEVLAEEGDWLDEELEN
jgi:C4-dicarboxylate transporter